MALFICGKYPELDITVKQEKKKIDAAGNQWIEPAESVKFKNKRLQLDDVEQKEEIASLRKHRDYNIIFHELDISKYEAKLKAASEPDPVLHMCPFCDTGFPDSRSVASHKGKCAKNPKAAKGKDNELSPTDSKHIRGSATTLNRVASPSDDPASDK